jgi:hypothetical protein
MVVEAALPRLFEAVAVGLADGFAAAGVLVVGGDVADPSRATVPNCILFVLSLIRLRAGRGW